MNAFTPRLLLVAAAACTFVAGAIGVMASTRHPIDSVLAQGEDHLPSQSAMDWVTYADHVVVVTATGDNEIPPSQEEIDHGEGLILRNVTFRVDRVLWSSPTASKSAPSSFDWDAFGWEFRNGSQADRVRMASRGRPRLEPGHTYILAITWESASCPPDDLSVPARWAGLGSDAILPYDGNIIGNGENEGRTQTTDVARARAEAPTDPNYTLEDKVTGQNAAALVAELDAAEPAPSRAVQTTPDPYACTGDG